MCAQLHHRYERPSSLVDYLLLRFQQVNSDKIFWQRNLDGTFSQIGSEKKAVGHCISTKAVGSDKRADITHLYKHKEGTGEHVALC